MRSLISNRLHWVALGVGILILAFGISIAAWSSQRDQGTGSVLSANEGRPAGDGGLGIGSGLIAADDAALSDSAALDARRAEPPAPHGGTGDVASVQDTAVLVVRDAEGNIKSQKTIK